MTTIYVLFCRKSVLHLYKNNCRILPHATKESLRNNSYDSCGNGRKNSRGIFSSDIGGIDEAVTPMGANVTVTKVAAVVDKAAFAEVVGVTVAATVKATF